MRKLGPLHAVEYIAPSPDDDDLVVYRHTFGAEGAALDESANRPSLHGREHKLTIRGGTFLVHPDRGICEEHEMNEVEVYENPRKRGKDGKFLPAKSRKRNPKAKAKPKRKRNPAKPAKPKRRKNPTKMSQKQVTDALIGAAVAVFGTRFATKAAADAAVKGTQLPAVLTNNVPAVVAVGGYLLGQKAKKASTRAIGNAAMVAAAAMWLRGYLAKRDLAAAGGVASVGQVSNGAVSAMSGLAERITQNVAQRSYGAASYRSPFAGAPGQVGALNYSPGDPVMDPGVNPGMQTMGSLGVDHDSLRDTTAWGDGGFGDLEWDAPPPGLGGLNDDLDGYEDR
jgi:hypothetical protein